MPELDKNFLDIQNEKLQGISKREERRLNSLFLKDKDMLVAAIAKGLTFHYFNDSMQKQIFQLIARYLDKYNAVLNRNSYMELVEKSFTAEDRIAMFKKQFDDIFHVEVSSGDFDHLFEGIEGRYLQKQAFDIVGRYYEPLVNLTSGQKKLVEEFQNEVALIKRPFDDNYNKIVSLSEMINKIMPEIDDRQLNPEKYIGIKTGFKTLDDMYNGFRRGKYVVICAMEGGGKTTIMLNFALNMMRAGYRVVYVTIESSAIENSYRALTIHSAVDINKIYHGGSGEDGISPYVKGELEQASKDLLQVSDNFHWVQCLQKTSWSRVEAMLNQKLAFTDIDAVYVDYLDEIGSEVSYPGRPDLELADVSSRVQSFGKKNDVLMVSAQQLKTPKVQELQKKATSGGDDFQFGTGDVSGTKKISAACDYLFGAFLDPLTRERVHMYNAKARHNKSAQRFTLSIDLNSGKMQDLPNTFEFRKSVSDLAETMGAELVKNENIAEQMIAVADKATIDDLEKKNFVKDEEQVENWLDSST